MSDQRRRLFRVSAILWSAMALLSILAAGLSSHQVFYSIFAIVATTLAILFAFGSRRS